MTIAVVVLAAGASSRMGTSKQLLPLGGKTIVWQTTNAACQAALGEVIVVTGSNAERVDAAVGDLPITSIYNPNWQDGQASSVVTGISALSGESTAAIFLPADQPLVTPELLRRLAELYQTSGSTAAAPCFKGRRGSPVLFDLSRWRQKLLKLAGDQGGRTLLNACPDEVSLLELTDDSVLFDADCLIEYEQLVKLWTRRAGCE